MIPEDPSFLVEKSGWGSKEILDYCKRVTIDNVKEEDSNLKELWDYLEHFDKGRSYPFEVSSDDEEDEPGIKIKAVKIVLHGVTLEIHSSWCALAMVVNHIIPPFNGHGEEQILAYCRSVLLLLAKWADAITEKLTPPHCPPVFTVSFAEIKDILEHELPSGFKGNLVAIVSTGKCVNLETDNPNYRLLNNELITARFRQFDSSFPLDPAGDCPFPIRPRGRAAGAPLRNAPNILANIDTEIRNSPEGSVKKKALEIYKSKVFADGKTKTVSPINHNIGGCAELWGFLAMHKIIKPGSCFRSISIAGRWAPHCIELHGEYKQKIVPCKKLKCPRTRGTSTSCGDSSNKTKPACLNCILLASAIEAKFGVLWEVVEGGFLATDQEDKESCPEGSCAPSQQAKRLFDHDQDRAETGSDRGKRTKECDMTTCQEDVTGTA